MSGCLQLKLFSNTAPRIGSTDVTGEIIHVNIVVGKVGPIRKIVFVPRNTEEFDLFVMAWEKSSWQAQDVA